MKAVLFLALVALAAAQDHGSGHSAMPMATAGPRDPCVEDPTQANCTSFRLPHATVQADLMALCKAMHFMPGCSLYKACSAAAPDLNAANGTWTSAVGAAPDVCRRLQLVATVCTHDTGMARMAGCTAHFNSMCGNGSTVAMCKQMPGFSQLPTTRGLNPVVKDLCSAKRARPGCAPCLAAFDANKTYGDCDLLATWGDICVAEPKLPQCANHTRLCAQDKTWTFCSGKAVAASDKGWSLLTAAAAAAPAAAAASAAAAPAPAALGVTFLAAAAAWLLLAAAA
ncbi:MAG: hypothetical protein J3K34DRAFT_525501 [Monoraphidium minutum]|nr:MAG: hypothetical protein J3K34DRAFT_525501 [Monoraphidium minutum]